MQQAAFELLKKDILNNLENVKDTSHDIDHVNRVKENALKICDVSGLQDHEIDKDLLQIVCYLHDFTFIKRKSNLITYLFEGRIVKNVVRKYLASYQNISDKERGIILNAVSKHSHSFPFRRLNKRDDLYTQILQDSDTLDLFGERRRKDLTNDYPAMMFFMHNMFKTGSNKVKKYLNIECTAEILKDKPKYFKPIIKWNSKNSDVLVILPGYADDPNNYEEISNILSYKKIVLIKPPTFRCFKKTYTIEELTKYLDSIISKNIKGRFDLLGFSFGGTMALDYVKNHKDNVSSLLLLHTWPNMSLKFNNKQIRFIKSVLKHNTLRYIAYKLFLSDKVRDLVHTPRLSDLKKVNYFSKFSTFSENSLYNGVEIFNNLDIKKQIIVSKDDGFLPLDKYINKDETDNRYVKVIDRSNHVKDKGFWANIEESLHEFYKKTTLNESF